MRSNACIAAGVVAVVALTVTGCSTSSSTPAESATTQPAPPGGGPGGGPGGPGGSQQVTEVDFDTDGVSAGGANTAEVVTATNAFLSSLDDTQRDTVEYDFTEDLARQTWSNFPATTVPREGIVLADLSAAQLEAAYTVLRTAQSPDGAQQDASIQASDDYLAGLGGQGAGGFGALTDYYVAVYGTPSETEPFMIQFGGHHLARNLTYNGDSVSQTPQFVGTEPTSFTAADGATVEPLAAESSAMFGIMSALTDEQRSAAEITSGTFDDLLVGPGKDSGVFPDPEGLLVSELDDAQRQIVMAAITAYAGDLSTGAATPLIAQYQAELDQTRIGWSNNTGPTDESSYIRIDGPTVWIEFINTRSRSTPDIHFHSVYRDKNNDYGSSNPS